MSVIKLTLPPGELPVNGKQVTFKAPCTCIETEAIQIEGVQYTVVDSLCRCVTGIGGRWEAGAVVSVILDVDNKRAHLQNEPGGISAETAELLGVTGTPTMDAAFGAVKAMLDVRSQFKFGSYVGTGTFGEGNPCTLTFDFTPMLVLVYDPADDISAVYNGQPASILLAPRGMAMSTRDSRVGANATTNAVTRISVSDRFTWGDNSFTWYTRVSGAPSGTVVNACAQLNDEGVTYNYIAFGV